MKVSQGHGESHVNTIPEYRFVSLFYKSRRPQSLSDHYYHTNRQIYLTTPFLSHNTYSLMRLPESLWNSVLFSCVGSVWVVDKGSERNWRSKADIFLRDDSRAKSNRMEQSLSSLIGSSFLVAGTTLPGGSLPRKDSSLWLYSLFLSQSPFSHSSPFFCCFN